MFVACELVFYIKMLIMAGAAGVRAYWVFILGSDVM